MFLLVADPNPANLERHQIAWIVGGIFALLGGIICLVSIYFHLQYNNHPGVRKHICRVVLMVPVYCLESWLGLRYDNYTMYWDVLRECYEAIAIYSFYSFLVAYLDGYEILAAMLREKGQTTATHTGYKWVHPRPFSWVVGEWQMGKPFVDATRWGALQYVPVKFVCAITTFITQLAGVYGDGEFVPNRFYPYIALIQNASQIWAMYCLVAFYLAAHEELHPTNPVAKFMCIKAVVFLTFWQSVIIAGFVFVGLVSPTQTYTVNNIAAGIQDLCICIEMFFAALAHLYAFPHMEFYHWKPTQHMAGGPATAHQANGQSAIGGADGAPIVESTVEFVQAPPKVSRMPSFLNPIDIAKDIASFVKPKKKAPQESGDGDELITPPSLAKISEPIDGGNGSPTNKPTGPTASLSTPGPKDNVALRKPPGNAAAISIDMNDSGEFTANNSNNGAKAANTQSAGNHSSAALPSYTHYRAIAIVPTQGYSNGSSASFSDVHSSSSSSSSASSSSSSSGQANSSTTSFLGNISSKLLTTRSASGAGMSTDQKWLGPPTPVLG